MSIMKPILPLLALAITVSSCSAPSDTARVADRAATPTTPPAIAPNLTPRDSSSGASIFREYSSESGIIEVMSEEMGTTITYYRDYGATKAIHTVREKNGITSKWVMIAKDGYATVYDLTSKTGQRMKLPMDQIARVMNSGPASSRAMFDSMSAADKVKYKFAELDPVTVAGKTGKGYSIRQGGFMTMRIWFWENIALRWEMEIGPIEGSQGEMELVPPEGGAPRTVRFETTRIETDVPVPDDRFEVPPNVEITEIGK